MDLFHESQRLLAALGAEGVAYALCGGLAVAVHGAPRFTSDIDILTEADQVERVVQIAKGLGFIFGAAPMRFRDGVEVHRWSKVVDGQVLTLDIHVVSDMYREAWATRETLVSDGVPISVLSREGLIQMKLFAARPKDLEDVANLRELDR